jgi:hypothetical protein
MVISLNDLDKKSGPVLHGPGKNLQQVAIIIVVDQNIVLL